MAYIFALYAGQQASTIAIDGVLTAASMSTAAVDHTCVQAPDGNIYFIDGFCIRKCDLSGRIITIAGAYATPGYVDDTGLAARFTNPRGIAVDISGNIYVTETSNFTIRKVTPAGVVTTWVGVNGSQNTTEGSGAGARCFNPTYLCYDGANTLFLIDNFRVRTITISTATTAALAGSNGLSGVTDGSGAAARFNIAGANGGAMWWQSARNVLVVMNPNNALTQFQVREVTLGGVTSTPGMSTTISLNGGIYGANAGLGGSLYGTSVAFVTVNGVLSTVTFSGGTYTVTNENIWSSHVGAGAAVRSNAVTFGGGTAIFGREFSAGGSNGILLETSGTIVNGLAINPSGGMNIDGTITSASGGLLAVTDLSGIYALTAGLTHDTYWDRQPAVVQFNTEIPNPSFSTGYVSD